MNDKKYPSHPRAAVAGTKCGVSNVCVSQMRPLESGSCLFNRTHSYRRLVRSGSTGKCCPKPNMRISYVRNFGIGFVFLWPWTKIEVCTRWAESEILLLDFPPTAFIPLFLSQLIKTTNNRTFQSKHILEIPSFVSQHFPVLPERTNRGERVQVKRHEPDSKGASVRNTTFDTPHFVSATATLRYKGGSTLSLITCCFKFVPDLGM